MYRRLTGVLFIGLLFTACGQSRDKVISNDGVERGANASNEDTYTLYRNSPIDPALRLHIATFDSIEGYDDRLYNYQNCERAKVAFQGDPVFKGTALFCELGYFKE